MIVPMLGNQVAPKLARDTHRFVETRGGLKTTTKGLVRAASDFCAQGHMVRKLDSQTLRFSKALRVVGDQEVNFSIALPTSGTIDKLGISTHSSAVGQNFTVVRSLVSVSSENPFLSLARP